MPIRFRCPGCDGLLSIARRKAGTDISCPKCGELVIVPTLPDDQTEADIEGVGDAVEAVAPPRSEPKKEPPKPESKPKREPGGVAVKDAPPKVEAEKPKPKPEKIKPKGDKSDAPLFERSDFEALLNPALEKAKGDEPKPLPPPAAEKPAAKAVVIAPTGMPEDSQGIFLSRGALTMMVVLGLVLLALAFAAGYLVGS
jgi:ribosomal protein S27E